MMLLAGGSLWAADVDATPPVPVLSDESVAVLTNGFSIRHRYREVINSGTTRLFLSESGDSFIDVSSDSIVELKIEPVESVESTKTATSQQLPAPARSLEEVVSAASERHRVDADLIRSVIGAESGFNAKAVPGKGAQGLMQLMPATATSLGVEDALNPEHNIEAGTHYLRDLLLMYNGDLVKALAAYNAGPERVARYNGVPPYAETRAYVARVIRDFNRKKVEQRRRSEKNPSRQTR